MRAVLLWKDGRREPTEHGGALKVIKPVHRDGRWTETTFVHSHEEEDGVWVYVEDSVRDTTDLMAKAAQSNRDRTMSVFRRGLDSSSCEVKKCKCPCHGVAS